MSLIIIIENRYVDNIISAGAQVLCVHGRTREQKGVDQNYADWEIIKIIRQHVPHIPIIANGNIRTFKDVEDCLEFTGADAVMSAESLLENPALFNGGIHVNPVQLCDEYVGFCEKYHPPDHNNVKRHIFKCLDRAIGEHKDLRIMLGRSNSVSKYREWIEHIKQNQHLLDLTPIDYEPSIMVIKDPDNHPIVKKPIKNKSTEDCNEIDECM